MMDRELNYERVGDLGNGVVSNRILHVEFIFCEECGVRYMIILKV